MSDDEAPQAPEAPAPAPAPGDPVPLDAPEQPHADDGLDLARALTRAAAGSTSRAARRRPFTGERRAATGNRVSGSHPDDRDPQLVDSTMARLIGERGWELDLRMRGVFARWAELVGDDVAAHCSPETFVDGRLVVRTDSTAWKTQLTLLAPTVVRRLNEELGHGTVTVLVVQGPHLPGWKKGRRTTRDGRGPRDTYG